MAPCYYPLVHYLLSDRPRSVRVGGTDIMPQVLGALGVWLWREWQE